MKKYLFLVIAVILLAACGSSKKALEAQNQLLLEQIAAKQESDRVQAMSNSPIRAARTDEACQILVDAEEDNMRALGTTIATIEKVARNSALRDARNNLATRIQVAIDGGASDEEENVNEDRDVATKVKESSVFNQFVKQTISNSKPIKWTVYDQSDGTIQVYVCVEIQSEKKEFYDQLKTLLKKEEIFKNEKYLDRYIEKLSKEIERKRK